MKQRKRGTSKEVAKDPVILPADPDEPQEGELDGEPDVETDDVETDGEPIGERDVATDAAEGLPALAEAPEDRYEPARPSDPLKRYIEELKKYPVLSPEEERKLAIRLRNEGDANAAKILVSANLRLVVRIALEYRNFYLNIFDLIQEGNIGLMKAVAKFDPTKGARLGYYASWWIRSYILKYILDNFRLVRIGTTQAQKKLFYHLMREKERLEAQGLLAGPKLLAEKLQVREKDVVEMQQRLSGNGAEVSLNTPLTNSDETTTSHMEMLADDGPPADELMANEELLRLVRRSLPKFEKKLKDKELSILKERLLAEEPKTLQEVADKYGLTRERVRQIETQVINKLRQFLRIET